jgi:hypothetical protein
LSAEYSAYCAQVSRALESTIEFGEAT